MKWKVLAVAAALAMSAPALAQGLAQPGADGLNFAEAIRNGEDTKAVQLLDANPQLANARSGKGETPLIVAVELRSSQWVGHLLNRKADPNLAARNGDTPLIVASRIGYEPAAEWLISAGAKVDAANRMGETPLIVAVQQRRPALVKLFLSLGADPDKADTAAGYSARDYAKRDTRNPQMLRLIEAAKRATR